MKFVFIFVVTGFAISGGMARAAGDRSELSCINAGMKALALSIKGQEKDVSFFNGALLGDGADALEIDMYKVVGKPGLYKVEQDGEDCTLRNIELVNN